MKQKVFIRRKQENNKYKEAEAASIKNQEEVRNPAYREDEAVSRREGMRKKRQDDEYKEERNDKMMSTRRLKQ